MIAAGHLAQQADDLQPVRNAIGVRQQLIARGDLAAGIAHDLGNLVAALHARLMVMQDQVAGDLRAHVEAVSAIAQAQASLVTKLRAQALPTAEPLVALDLLADVVRLAVQIAESQPNDDGPRAVIQIDRSLAGLGSVLGFREELVHVLLNLLLNARQAMPRGGTIHLSAVADETNACLRVDDEGTGIPEHHLRDLFRPLLFTTKGAAGTGLGLAMAREVLRRAGGEITASSRPEGGARFELRLRTAGVAAAADAASSAARAPSSATRPPTGRGNDTRTPARSLRAAPRS